MSETSVSASIDAAYILVDYVWAVLKANEPETWDTAKYDGLIPIVPLSEEPELAEFTGPHIVYGYAEEGSGDLWARNTGSLTLAVYDDKYRRLSRTLNYLRAALERQDETARDVNEFSTVYGNGQYLGLRFGSIGIAFLEGGTPETAEGGRQSGILAITYDYFVDYDIITSVV